MTMIPKYIRKNQGLDSLKNYENDVTEQTYVIIIYNIMVYLLKNLLNHMFM